MLRRFQKKSTKRQNNSYGPTEQGELFLPNINRLQKPSSDMLYRSYDRYQLQNPPVINEHQKGMYTQFRQSMQTLTCECDMLDAVIEEFLTPRVNVSSIKINSISETTSPVTQREGRGFTGSPQKQIQRRVKSLSDEKSLNQRSQRKLKAIAKQVLERQSQYKIANKLSPRNWGNYKMKPYSKMNKQLKESHSRHFTHESPRCHVDSLPLISMEYDESMTGLVLAPMSVINTEKTKQEMEILL